MMRDDKTATDTEMRGGESGRCGAKNGVAGGAKRRAKTTDLTTQATGQTGENVAVKLKLNHKDIGRVKNELGAQNINWDGWVRDEKGNQYWVDEETVRGNYPKDCPKWVRHRIGQLAATMGGVDGATKVETAIWARTQKYKVSDEKLRSHMKTTANTYTNSRGHTRVARQLDVLDVGELELFVKKCLEPELAELVRTSVARGAPLTGYFTNAGRIVGVSGIVSTKRGGVVVGNLETNDVPSATSLLVCQQEIHSQRQWDGGGQRCMTCRTDRALCVCAVGNDARRKELDMFKNKTPTTDHYWGDAHSVAVNSALLQAAKEFADDLSRWGHQTDSTLAARLEELGGQAVWHSIAVYFEQTRVTPDERQELLTTAMKDIAELLDTTTERAQIAHRDYTRSLYAEFDAPRAVLGDVGVQEIYLGRDGVYPYIARKAMREVYAQRGDARAERHELQYLSVSRNAQLKTKHQNLLGDLPAVVVDTGYYGSIPERMAEIAGLEIEDFTKTKTLSAGKIAIRLMATEKNDSYGFAWQTPRPYVDLVEDDAKTTRAARYVGDAAPAGALEQLVYRQLEHCIQKTAKMQTAAILRGEQNGALNLDDELFGHAKRGPNARLRKDLYSAPLITTQTNTQA